MTISKTLITITIFLICILLLNSCDNTNGPVINNDIVPQTDILWPSLADSPWPMNHHDPQSTGRSKYLGPKTGNIKLKIPYYGIESALSIGIDDCIYITTGYSPMRISVFDNAGNIKWEKHSYFLSTTPLIGANSIYWSDRKGLHSETMDGERNWSYETLDLSDWIDNIGINIGLDGTIYGVTTKKVLKAISPSGELLWELHDNRFLSDANGAPTFSPDGKTLYVQGTDVSVLAVDINKRRVKWVFGDTMLLSSPVVDSQGNIYFTPGQYLYTSLYSLTPEGNMRWEFNYAGEAIMDNTEPTIDYDGNIYFGVTNIYSLTNSGKLRWKYDLEGMHVVSPLVSDVEGNIFVGLINNSDLSKSAIISVNNKGKLNWKTVIEGERALGASPAITKYGELIFPTFRAFNILIIN